MKTILQKLSLLAVALLLYTGHLSAQQYGTGVGLRLGAATRGINVKHFLNLNSALEGVVGINNNSVILTALYEYHTPFPKAEGLSWYFGGGAHVGYYHNNYWKYYYESKNHKYYYYYSDWDSKWAVGVDLLVGLEYKFKNTPIAIGMDVKPYVDYYDDFFGYWDAAFNFRFTL